MATDAPQTANTVYAGPSSGGVGVPTFRQLVTADVAAFPGASNGQALFGVAGGSETSNLVSRTTHGHRLPLASMLKWLTD